MTLVFSTCLIVEGGEGLATAGNVNIYIFMVASDLLGATQWRSSKDAAPYAFLQQSNIIGKLL
jgi:hypothetical protein